MFPKFICLSVLVPRIDFESGFETINMEESVIGRLNDNKWTSVHVQRREYTIRNKIKKKLQRKMNNLYGSGFDCFMQVQC